MGIDDPSVPGLAEEKAKISQACLQSFCFYTPHSRGECTCVLERGKGVSPV
jgi:hypothetical protein